MKEVRGDGETVTLIIGEEVDLKGTEKVGYDVARPEDKNAIKLPWVKAHNNYCQI